MQVAIPLQNLAWLGSDGKVHTVQDGLKGQPAGGPPLLGATAPTFQLQSLAGFVSDPDSPLHTLPKFAADGTTTFVLPKEAKNVNIKQNSMYIPGAPHPW